MNNLTEIPKLTPLDFDGYLFADWKPEVSSIYEHFHIARIEDYKRFLTLPVLPHRRSVYFFIYISKGFMVRSKGLSTYKLESNTFFCLSTGQITSIEAISDDIEGFYCHFQPEIFKNPILNVIIERDFPFFQIPSVPVINISQEDRCLSILEILLEEKTKNELKRTEILSFYLVTLLEEIKQFYVQTSCISNNAASNLTQRYQNLLIEFIFERKSVIDFADILSVTPNHLNKSVKSTTGKSAHHLLEEMRVLEAKVLLKQTNIKISEIAFKLGGFEPSDFSRFFKSMTGISPKEYRNLSN